MLHRAAGTYWSLLVKGAIILLLLGGELFSASMASRSRAVSFLFVQYHAASSNRTNEVEAEFEHPSNPYVDCQRGTRKKYRSWLLGKCHFARPLRLAWWIIEQFRYRCHLLNMDYPSSSPFSIPLRC